ncbi:MAG TPA: hypothetical protein VJS37_14055 [Terriglobales bacterium]|nr:hypothetical protein [Terriglobales bacterium]
MKRRSIEIGVVTLLVVFFAMEAATNAIGTEVLGVALFSLLCGVFVWGVIHLGGEGY